ncbi:MAG: hypothetical protein JRJ46_02835 [Deltaproteobacteria bacterium]|nr:hypothetical protein [Deltaproteobacteria bacterium]
MKSKLEEIKTEIEKLHDEIKLKAHLGKAEAKDELEKLTYPKKRYTLYNKIERGKKC